jgi:hypothetical protein
MFKNVTIDQGVDENCNLDIFEMKTSTNELAKEHVNMELLNLGGFR